MAKVFIPKWMKLVHLIDNYEMTLNQICKYFDINYSNSYMILKILEQKGLIEMQKDRGRLNLMLTEKGLDMVEIINILHNVLDVKYEKKEYGNRD